MELCENRDEHGVTVRIDRSLDLTSAGALDASLTLVFDSGEEAVHVDIASVQSIDSAGLTVFLKWHRRALAQNRRFALVRATDFHRKLLEITRLDEELVVLDRPGGVRQLPARQHARRATGLLEELGKVL